MNLIKWKKNKDHPEDHKFDYRFIEDIKEKEIWIRKYWEVKE